MSFFSLTVFCEDFANRKTEYSINPSTLLMSKKMIENRIRCAQIIIPEPEWRRTVAKVLKKKLPAHVTCNTCHLMIADVDRLKLDSPKHLIRLRKPFLNSKRSSRNDGSIPPVNLLVTTWTFLQVLQPGVVTLVKCCFFFNPKDCRPFTISYDSSKMTSFVSIGRRISGLDDSSFTLSVANQRTLSRYQLFLLNSWNF